MASNDCIETAALIERSANSQDGVKHTSCLLSSFASLVCNSDFCESFVVLDFFLWRIRLFLRSGFTAYISLLRAKAQPKEPKLALFLMRAVYATLAKKHNVLSPVFRSQEWEMRDEYEEASRCSRAVPVEVVYLHTTCMLYRIPWHHDASLYLDYLDTSACLAGVAKQGLLGCEGFGEHFSFAKVEASLESANPRVPKGLE